MVKTGKIENPKEDPPDETPELNENTGNGANLTTIKKNHASFIAEAKTLLLILILVAVVILVVFNVISNEIENMLLAEKLIEKHFQVALIAEQTERFIEKGDDWTSEYDYYIGTILVSLEMIDALEMTYAAVFDQDLANLSVRSPSYEGSAFEPTVSPEFVDAVKTNELGDYVLPFTPKGSKERDMYIHYRWLPAESALENRVLIVVAISKYTINTRISTWIQIIAILLVIAVFVGGIFFWRRRSIITQNVKLEETVKKRTAELEETTEAAKQASMAKGAFLSNMSHEMRTPMNAIIGMTAIAKNSDDLSHKDYCLSKIEDASTHLLSVINDILDMSKIEANKFELSVEKFNFERILQKVSNVVGFRVDEKHQEFSIYIDKNIPPYLMGDDQHITQVITNLMSNAVKFTPEYGKIWLNAYLLDETDGICTIKVEVIDTGIGISEEQQARLFGSFVQAENSTTRKFGGTGLGLAISKHIVEMMNGEIRIESELGRGAKFTFTIKAERVSDTLDGLLEQGINWENMSVLVVDDSQETRGYFADIMQRFGSKCDVASSGEEAIEFIKHNGQYNIYFVDWQMGGMNGIELARHIKVDKDGEDNKSVVIMISSNEWNEIKDAAKDAGINRFLPKPLFPSMIADCINECLGSDNIMPGKRELNYKGIFKNCRIILAEDVDVNREIVISLLEPTEVIIDTAENGVEAVELFEKNPDIYNMIFMDVQMPEMDGYDATRKIRAMDNPEAKSIPIVAMTANVFKEDIDKCLASGMNDHLGKPINYEKMISKIAGYLFATKQNI